MKRSFGKHTTRDRFALAAVAAIASLAIETAQAQEFVVADITINSVGFLECAFKETGLTPGAQVSYGCNASDVGWVTQCFVKNKPVTNIPPRLHVAHNADGLTTLQDRIATNRGTVTWSILTAYPTVEEEIEEPLCPEVEGLTITEEITAIRWCNAELIDVTNNIQGATEPSLFEQLIRNGSSDIPECGELAALPTDI